MHYALVSVIIPVYQVEKYLDKCIASVVGQTYQNLQIILIDDGSTDRSPAICDDWKERDPRITVIHQPNGGLSRTRNAGLKLATGEFIGFVDSDDWIESNMVECLLSALQETDADIAIGGYDSFTEKSENVIHAQSESSERKLLSSEEALKKLLLVKGYLHNYVWNKLYRRSILADIAFPEGKLYEDIPWTAEVIGNAKTIVYIDQICYHCLIRLDSLSRDVRNKEGRVHDELDMLEQRIDYIHHHYPALKKFAVMRLHNFCCREYLEFASNFSHLDTDGKIRTNLYHHFCQYRPSIIWDKQDISKGIARILFWLCPSLLCRAKILKLKA